MTRVNVLQVTDTLAAGGAERVAVNLANLLPRERFSSGVCTTRREGPLAALIQPDVQRIALQRTVSFDITAIGRLAAFARASKVAILHAHDSAVFVAIAASKLPPFPRVIWHIHFGGHAEEPSAGLYRLASFGIDGVITVSTALADWVRDCVGVARSRVWCIPNFACVPQGEVAPAALQGTVGARIVCVANLRPEKNHAVLLNAMAQVVREVPHAHLILAGAAPDEGYATALRRLVVDLRLSERVTFLGDRDDVASVLRGCDVGVLSSRAEGFPLALVEYGNAQLPAVATRVGECPEILEHGLAGRLVDRDDVEALAGTLIELLRNPEMRAALAARLHQRVRTRYSPTTIVQRVCAVYDQVLNGTTANVQTLRPTQPPVHETN